MRKKFGALSALVAALSFPVAPAALAGEADKDFDKFTQAGLSAAEILRDKLLSARSAAAARLNLSSEAEDSLARDAAAMAQDKAAEAHDAAKDAMDAARTADDKADRALGGLDNKQDKITAGQLDRIKNWVDGRIAETAGAAGGGDDSAARDIAAAANDKAQTAADKAQTAADNAVKALNGDANDSAAREAAVKARETADAAKKGLDGKQDKLSADQLDRIKNWVNQRIAAAADGAAAKAQEIAETAEAAQKYASAALSGKAQDDRARADAGIALDKADNARKTAAEAKGDAARALSGGAHDSEARGAAADARDTADNAKKLAADAAAYQAAYADMWKDSGRKMQPPEGAQPSAGAGAQPPEMLRQSKGPFLALADAGGGGEPPVLGGGSGDPGDADDPVLRAQRDAGMVQNYIKNYADGVGERSLSQANAYTDKRYNQLNSKISKLRGRVDAGVSGATAIASLAFDNSKANSLSGGFGVAKDKVSGAMGYQRNFGAAWRARATVAAGEKYVQGGGAVGFSW